MAEMARVPWFPVAPFVGADGVTHGEAGKSEYVIGEGWVRYCLCGRKCVSRQDWQHVPAFYDHLAMNGAGPKEG